MNVYLMRHGEASAGPSGEVELTARGREQAEEMAVWLAGQGVELDRILHSSKLRARQTAAIVNARLEARDGVHEHAGLAPDDDPFAVAAMCESAEAPILIVSHLPLLDHVGSLLAENDARRVIVGFATAQVACFAKNGEGWSMTWTKRPG